jgi:hypothetical protein
LANSKPVQFAFRLYMVPDFEFPGTCILDKLIRVSGGAKSADAIYKVTEMQSSCVIKVPGLNIGRCRPKSNITLARHTESSFAAFMAGPPAAKSIKQNREPKKKPGHL